MSMRKREDQRLLVMVLLVMVSVMTPLAMGWYGYLDPKCATLLSGLFFASAVMANKCGHDTGEITGWNEAFDANNQADRPWVFRDDVHKDQE